MNKNKEFKQYFTPQNIAKIIVKNIDIENLQNAIDLSVGEGELLKACKERWDNLQLVGFDIDKEVLNKVKKEIDENIELINGDSLEEKTYLKAKKYNEILLQGGFDLCIGNPPFDAYYKINIKGKDTTVPIEYLFLKKYMSICKENGYLVIILPNGILTNKFNDYIRKEIIREMDICKIIGLPNNIFTNAYAKTEVLILKKKQTEKNNYKIEFINIINDNNIERVIVSNIKKCELIERMDCEYYLNRKKVYVDISTSENNIKFVKMSEIVKEHNRGATVYGEKRYFVEHGLRYLHTTNITNIGIDYSKKEKYIEKGSVMDKKVAHTKVGDVLVVRVGNKCAGRTAIINSKQEIGVASDCIYIFRLKDIDPYYFVILMKSNFMNKRLQLLKHGSCATVISKRDLLNLNIPIISEAMQKKIHMKYRRLLNKYAKDKSEQSLLNINIGINALIDLVDKILL